MLRHSNITHTIRSTMFWIDTGRFFWGGMRPVPPSSVLSIPTAAVFDLIFLFFVFSFRTDSPDRLSSTAVRQVSPRTASTEVLVYIQDDVVMYARTTGFPRQGGTRIFHRRYNNVHERTHHGRLRRTARHCRAPHKLATRNTGHANRISHGRPRE